MAKTIAVKSTLFLLITLALAACSVSQVDIVSQTDPIADEHSSSGGEVMGSGDAEVEQVVISEVSEPNPSPTIEPTATDPVVIPTATEVVEQVPIPTVRVDLSATSPGAVNLASGGVQLIEFFAHW